MSPLRTDKTYQERSWLLAWLIFASCLPTAFAAEEAGTAIDTAGFWVSICLILVVSAVEAALSVLWTRVRVSSDGIHPCELSCRVCGRELWLYSINNETAKQLATNGLHSGFYFGTTNSMIVSGPGSEATYGSSDTTCSLCTGYERKRSNGVTEAVIDMYGSIALVPTILIRRFNPKTSLKGATSLVDNVRAFFSPGKYNLGRLMEHAVHLLVGLTDVSLGIAGLALNPGSPQKLYTTLKDPEAPMTFENYCTLFLMYWVLGALLYLCMLPMKRPKRSIQMFGWPGHIAFGLASLASVVLFALGCWKIDVARRNHRSWMAMLSYWIAGASAVSVPMCGFDMFDIFGVVGLGFMLNHTFN
jgi:hypothetical protein